MTSRQIFSESEKTCLQELIIKYKLNKSSTLAAGSQNYKKAAWKRLTEEYNAIETNATRNEAQLKKCWDNLKTRQKSILTHEKRQRMRTGGGPLSPNDPSTSRDILLPEALIEHTDVELRGVIDSDTIYTSGDVIMEVEFPLVTPESEEVPCARPSIERGCIDTPTPHGRPGSSHRDYGATQSQGRVVDTPPRGRPGSHNTDYGATQSQGTRNIRTRVIQDEFEMRKESYTKAETRENELHKLKILEREWMAKAAEETYLKVKAEREAAEELLQCNIAKRKLAELQLAVIDK